MPSTTSSTLSQLSIVLRVFEPVSTVGRRSGVTAQRGRTVLELESLLFEFGTLQSPVASLSCEYIGITVIPPHSSYGA